MRPSRAQSHNRQTMNESNSYYNEVDSTLDVESLLEDIGFNAGKNVLTYRQAEVFALREHGFTQRAIAENLGTSRANISNIESSARANIERASETVKFAETLTASIQVKIPDSMDLYSVPKRIFDAADAVDVELNYTPSELRAQIRDKASDAIHGRNIEKPLVVTITTEGAIQVVC